MKAVSSAIVVLAATIGLPIWREVSDLEMNFRIIFFGILLIISLIRWWSFLGTER
jgi:hypothetical protein